ncbi:MAG TPA: protein kinase [Gemmataceae bacterium]|nr:protein kinase [Gemmataceae bacterium]
MTAEQPDIETIFNAAGPLPPPERAAYLDQACGDDVALRQRIERLLNAQAELGSFLESPAPELDAALDVPTISERPGTVIGPYKLLEQIGEGGFGVVFLAEQTQPVRRKVALKVLKPGMDTRQVVARFEAERQALALMDHANIAKVFDGGATAAGRPYFVMELVRGVPITEYCDQNHLSPRQRLELFVHVCQAVQHAHQKGIIHRDLKPSNILVVMHDSTPVVKVIDFGVAKALGQELTEKTLFTGFAQMIGTPMYMSPEQAGQSGLDIDTRSDIYSLGVLLYELLTGATPFDKERFRSAEYDEIRRIIREEEPVRPSTKLSTLGRSAATVSAGRGRDPRGLSRLFRGEVDWIVIKALEKDRSRRYDTASALAADVQRYVHDEPVQACPPSIGYRFRKFARRNKRPVLAAALVVVALVGGITGTTWGMLRATDAEAKIKDEQEQTNEALGREKQAKDDLIQTLYYQRIGAAAYARDRNRHALAEELLEQCPPELRGWEWHYVKRLPFSRILELPHDDVVSGVAWSPDGRLLASGSLNGSVKVWDAWTEGPPLFELPTLKRVARHLAFSPDGTLLATGGEDDWVKLWDISRPDRPPDQPFRKFATGLTALLALAFSPDGRHLAAADRDGKIRVWDVADNSEVRLPDDVPVIRGLAFTPSGKQIVTVNTEGVIKVWDLASRRTIAEFPASTRAVGYRAAFSRDRRLVAIGYEDGRITIVKTEPLEEVRTLEAHTSEIADLAFGADDERLASSGNDLIVKVWDLRTWQEAFALDKIERRVNGLAFSPDGHRLAMGGGDGTVRILDATPLDGPGDAGQALTLVGHDHAVVGLAYSPDSGRIVSASQDGTAKVWDAHSGHEVKTFRGHRLGLTRVAWSPDGRRVASASWDGTARVWDAATGAEVLSPLDAKAGPVYGLAFTPDGRALATAHYDGTVRVWDAGSGQQLVWIDRAHTRPVLAVTFCPDGKRLVSAGGGDNFIKVWDWQARPPKLERTLVAPQNIIRNPEFSPDNSARLVAVVNAPPRFWMWDMTPNAPDEGKPVKGMPRDLPNCKSVSQAFFRPGGRLAVVSSDRIQFLEADDSEGPALVGGHAGDIGCAAFSPDGKQMATGAGFKGHGEVRIWDVSRWEKKP